MSTLNFPTSPSLNDVYSFGGKTWIWNGVAWQLDSTNAINNIPIGNTTANTGNFTTLTADSLTTVGNVTANYFFGNGSLLTGVSASTNQIFNGDSNVDIAAANADITMSVAGTANVVVVSTDGITVQGNVIGNGIPTTTTSNTAPTNPEQGDIWINIDNGRQYIYFTAGGNSQWAEMEAYQIYNANVSVGPGNLFVANTSPVGASPGDVWIDTDTGTQLIFFTAGGNSQWAEMEADQSFSFSGGSVDFTSIASNVLPAANVTYDLGSTANRWNDLWLANSTIYIGGAQISASGTTLELPATIKIGTVTLSETGGNLDLPENISANVITAVGNITGSNFNTAGVVEATGNVSGGNIETVGVVTATGNVSAGNIETAGVVTATGNISGGNIETAGEITATGNITGGNIETAGEITATGNITGGNLSGINITGTLTTAAQINITEVGNLGNTQINSLGVGTAASGNVGEIRATDNITAYFSDRRLKEISGTIPDAIDKVMSLSGIQFVNNDVAAQYGYRGRHPQVGVIAQEVQQVLPEAVVPAPFDIGLDDKGNEISQSGQNYLTVHYDRIIPLLIEAIKQQQHMIWELQKKLG